MLDLLHKLAGIHESKRTRYQARTWGADVVVRRQRSEALARIPHHLAMAKRGSAAHKQFLSLSSIEQIWREPKRCISKAWSCICCANGLVGPSGSGKEALRSMLKKPQGSPVARNHSLQALRTSPHGSSVKFEIGVRPCTCSLCMSSPSAASCSCEGVRWGSSVISNCLVRATVLLRSRPAVTAPDTTMRTDFFTIPAQRGKERPQRFVRICTHERA